MKILGKCKLFTYFIKKLKVQGMKFCNICTESMGKYKKNTHYLEFREKNPSPANDFQIHCSATIDKCENYYSTKFNKFAYNA